MRTHLPTDRRRPGARLAPWAALAAVTLALTGCAGAADGADGAAPGSGGGDVADDDVPADTPVLQVEQGGGFVMPGYDFMSVPYLTVYGDGRAIVPGPQIMIYPGPALPNLQTHDLSADDVAALLDSAREAGLLAEGLDYGQPPVADVPTTFVTLTAGGTTYVHEVAALGFADGTDAGDAGEGLEPMEPADTLSADQLEARQALATFLAEASELVNEAPEGGPLELDRFAIQARPTDDPMIGGIPEGGETLPWPLGVALDGASECTLVEGAEAEALAEALADANQATVWDQSGTTYAVWVRPLLPGEPGCADLR